jgi:hypothetical protein
MRQNPLLLFGLGQGVADPWLVHIYVERLKKFLSC